MRVGFLLLLPLSASSAFARIGDSPDDLAQRFGSPSALILDSKGYGLGVYRAEGFKQIRVTFVAGKSQYEIYLPSDNEAPRDAIAATLESENPGEDVYDASSLGIWVGHREEGGELKYVNRSGRHIQHTGRLELKSWGNRRGAVVRSHEAVVEIPFGEEDVEFRRLQPGIEATITMLDEVPTDLDAPIAFIGRREHVDPDDAFSDAHSIMHTLVKIESGEEVLFDRTVCGVHQTQMQLSNASVAYGLLMSSKVERYCDEAFPHARAFARGGCVVTPDSPEFIPIYQCPKCVAACAEYAASQAAVAEP
jgi:hypothetical protein